MTSFLKDILTGVEGAGKDIYHAGSDVGQAVETGGKDIYDFLKTVNTGKDQYGKDLRSYVGTRAEGDIGKKHVEAYPSTITKSTETGTETPATTTKKTKKSQSTTKTKTDYAEVLQSLLNPFVHAVGGLPKELSNLSGQIKSSSDYTPDEMATQLETLAKQYAPTSSYNITSGTKSLNAAEASVTSNINDMLSPTGTFGSALSSLKTDDKLYEKYAPYHALETALMNRERYQLIYDTGVAGMTGQGEWPKYVQSVYSNIMGTPISTKNYTPASAAATSTNIGNTPNIKALQSQLAGKTNTGTGTGGASTPGSGSL